MRHDDLYDNLLIELEQEYTNRKNEISKMENFIQLHKDESSKETIGIMRKSLILVLYSHFEGYCKQVLQYYVIYVNKEHISACDAKAGLIAANMFKEFHKLFDSNHKPIVFNHQLREDGILQQHGRRREFIESFDEIMANKIDISEEFIDTESNLKSHVLKKLLYQLELDYTIVDNYQNEINKLVNIRNSYAHGDRTTYPDEKEYANYRKAVFDLMEDVKNEVEDAYYKKLYLKAEHA